MGANLNDDLRSLIIEVIETHKPFNAVFVHTSESNFVGLVGSRIKCECGISVQQKGWGAHIATSLFDAVNERERHDQILKRTQEFKEGGMSGEVGDWVDDVSFLISEVDRLRALVHRDLD